MFDRRQLELIQVSQRQPRVYNSNLLSSRTLSSVSPYTTESQWRLNISISAWGQEKLQQGGELIKLIKAKSIKCTENTVMIYIKRSNHITKDTNIIFDYFHLFFFFFCCFWCVVFPRLVLSIIKT